MEAANTPPANPLEDANAIAAAGATAAATATEAGQSTDDVKKAVKEAITEAADERGLKGFGEQEATMVADAVIKGLEAQGAFNPPPTPEPAADEVAAAAAAAAAGAQPAPAAGATPAPPAPPAPDNPPAKKTFAEKYLRG